MADGEHAQVLLIGVRVKGELVLCGVDGLSYGREAGRGFNGTLTYIGPAYYFAVVLGDECGTVVRSVCGTRCRVNLFSVREG